MGGVMNDLYRVYQIFMDYLDNGLCWVLRNNDV